MKKFLFSFLFLANTLYSQILNELIQPIHFTTEKTDTLLLSDIFFAYDYDVKFSEHQYINIIHQKYNNIIILTPKHESDGLTLLNFSHQEKEYSIPIFIHQQKKYIFTYTPQKPVEKIQLFGNFNNWNRENLPMFDDENTGTYSTQLFLKPGRYEYKFFVDGEEILDPKNPSQVPNGLGGFNSVLTIEQPHPEKTYLHILGKKDFKDSLIFSFEYEREKQNAPLQHSDIIALFDNQKVSTKCIRIKKNQIDIVITKSFILSYSTLRIAVTQNNHSTNIQTIFLHKENFSWHDAIMYSLVTDRFFDGDTTNTKPISHPQLLPPANYNGGDWKGILQKITEGYFDSLGVNVLWISPVNENTNNAFPEYPPPHRYYAGYHGYWPTHQTQVEEKFGTMELLKKLITTAHQHNIKILLDFVAHHVHEEHPYYQQHKNWFGTLELPDGRKNLRMWDEHRLTTWFEPYLPSFDYTSSQEALDTMTSNAVWWLKETNADGFRHDAVKHIPNIFWRTLTKKIKTEIEIPQHKKIYQIGETFGSYELIHSYVNNGQLSAQFNFNLYDAAISTFLNSNMSFQFLDDELKNSFSMYGVNNLMGNIMDSHDKVRFPALIESDANGDAGEIAWTNPPKIDSPQTYQKTLQYLYYLLTIPGIPTIYYGNEIALTGSSDPDNRRIMRFETQLSQKEKTMLEETKKIISLRKNHSALRYGDFQTLLANQQCYAYLRSDMDERILVAHNKSGISQTITVSLPHLYKIQQAKNLLEKENISTKNNSVKITLPPFASKVFLVK